MKSVPIPVDEERRLQMGTVMGMPTVLMRTAKPIRIVPTVLQPLVVTTSVKEVNRVSVIQTVRYVVMLFPIPIRTVKMTVLILTAKELQCVPLQASKATAGVIPVKKKQDQVIVSKAAPILTPTEHRWTMTVMV